MRRPVEVNGTSPDAGNATLPFAGSESANGAIDAGNEFEFEFELESTIGICAGHGGHGALGRMGAFDKFGGSAISWLAITDGGRTLGGSAIAIDGAG